MINWGELFTYDANSPTGLRWKQHRFGYQGRKVVSAGDVAGTIKADGYRGIVLDGKGYLAHRVVWEMHHGTIPEGKTVDHIDGNKANNSLSNLRLVSNAINVRNKAKYRNNTSGQTGVYWDEENQRAIARWNDLDGTQRSKTFRAWGGEKEAAIAVAKAFRDMKLAALNTAGAGYTERHGS